MVEVNFNWNAPYATTWLSTRMTHLFCPVKRLNAVALLFLNVNLVTHQENEENVVAENTQVIVIYC